GAYAAHRHIDVDCGRCGRTGTHYGPARGAGESGVDRRPQSSRRHSLGHRRHRPRKRPFRHAADGGEQVMKAYVWPVDGTPPPTATPSRWRRFVERHLPSVVIYLMVATLVAIVLYPHMVVTVPSGQVGVLWKRFGGGTVLDPRKLKNEGFNLISPWNRVFLYDLRLQSFTEPYNAISSDGVSLTATVIVRFRLQRDAVPVLHQAIGPNYEQVLVQPGIGSLTRQVIAEYTAEQAYSTARQEIQDKIRNLVEERLSEKMMEHAGEEGEESYRVSMSDTLILYDILV